MDPANPRRKLIRSGCHVQYDGRYRMFIDLPFVSGSKIVYREPTTAEWIAFLLEVRDTCMKEDAEFLALFCTSKEELMKNFEFTIQFIMEEDLKSKL